MAITFDAEGTWPGCIHGWDESIERIKEGRRLVTSQMGLLTYPLVKRNYDEVRIIRNDVMAVLRKTDGRWMRDGQLVKATNNWLNLWKSGKLDGDIPVPRSGRTKGRTFDGTPIECEAWLREQLEVMRLYVVGATSEMVDGNLVPKDDQEEKLEKYERTIWHLSIDSTELMSDGPIRDDMISKCERIKSERELFGLLSAG